LGFGPCDSGFSIFDFGFAISSHAIAAAARIIRVLSEGIGSPPPADG
jgi:hypothetical protein